MRIVVLLESVGETVELHMYKLGVAFKNSATAAKLGTLQRPQCSSL